MRIEKNNLTRGSVLIATGLILPIVFHAFNLGGQIFLPMHIPVLIGGFILNPMYAAVVGIVTPLLSTFFTGMPAMPFSWVMMLELCTYGWVTSVLHGKYLKNIYTVMIISLIAGRIIGCIGNYLLLTYVSGQVFSFTAYIKTVTFVAIPGIVIQLILVPALVVLLLRYENTDIKNNESNLAENQQE